MGRAVWQTRLPPIRAGAAWMLATVFGLALSATPAEAQVHVAVGIFAPRVGAHVIVGAPRVYVDDRYYYQGYRHYDPYRRRDRGRWRDEREYYRDLRDARR